MSSLKHGRLAVLLILALVFSMPCLVRSAVAGADDSAPRLTQEHENLGARDGTTREYIRTYEVTNPAEPNAEPMRYERKLVEKADGLNYDAALTGTSAGPANWQPTVNQFVAQPGGGWKIETGPAKVTVAGNLITDPLVTYEVPYRSASGEVRRVRQALGAGVVKFVNSQNTLLGTDRPRPVWGRAEGNKIIYEGAFACGDLELVYENGTLHQNVIVKNRTALPDSSLTDIRAEVHTTVINLSTRDEARSAIRIIGEDQMLAFSDPAAQADARPVVWFDESKAWSRGNPEKSQTMRRRVTIGLREGEFTHIESLPLTEIIQTPADQPYVLDYQYKNDINYPMQRSEAWQPGVTYFISSSYTIPSGKTLAIEGGAIIKCNPLASLIVQGSFLARGTARNYILFAAGNNTTVGENVSGSGPVANYYIYFNVSSAETGSATLEYCKFGDSPSMAVNVHDFNYQVDASTPNRILTFKNCIFRGGSNGIGVTKMSFVSSPVWTLKLHNCLFAGVTYPLYTTYPFNNLSAEVFNCTMDGSGGTSKGIFLLGSCAVNIKNCLFSNFGTSSGSAISATTAASGAAQGNHYYGGATQPFSLSANVTVTQPNNVTGAIGSTPLYITDTTVNLTGSYYLNPTFWSGTIPTGMSTSISNELQKKTVLQPYVLVSPTNDLTIDPADDSTPAKRDSIGTQIGYHYDPVDALYNSTIQFSKTFRAKAGSVIAGNTNSILYFNDADSVKEVSMIGEPNKPVILTNVNATSDRLLDPYPQYADIKFGKMKKLEVDYARFEFLHYGLNFTEKTPAEISNSVFYKNTYGVSALYSSWPFDIYISLRNCLFDQQTYSAVDLYCPNHDQGNIELDVIGCTFYKNVYQALNLYGNTITTEKPWRLVIEDNIFTSNYRSVYNYMTNLSDSELQDITRNNIFWNNRYDTTSDVGGKRWLNSVLRIGSSTGFDPSIYYENANNPMLVHRARPDLGSIFYLYDQYVMGNTPLDDYRYDGFYLAQVRRIDPEKSDVSRRPFYLDSGRTLKNPGGLSLSYGMPGPPNLGNNGVMDIYVISDANIGNETSQFRGYRQWTSGTPATPAYNTSTAAGALAIYIKNNGEGDAINFVNKNKLTLEFTNGTKLEVWPPLQSIARNEALCAYIAEDGSVYYASNVSPYKTWDFDANYALRFSLMNPPRIAYDCRYDDFYFPSASPAVDSGSEDFLSAGSTKTDLGLDNPAAAPSSGGLGQVTDPDNLVYDSASVTHLATWDNGNKTLDIGYHYLGQELVTDKPQAGDTQFFTLRYPKQRLEKFWMDPNNYSLWYEDTQQQSRYEASVDKLAINASSSVVSSVTSHNMTAAFELDMGHSDTGTDTINNTNYLLKWDGLALQDFRSSTRPTTLRIFNESPTNFYQGYRFDHYVWRLNSVAATTTEEPRVSGLAQPHYVATAADLAGFPYSYGNPIVMESKLNVFLKNDRVDRANNSAIPNSNPDLVAYLNLTSTSSDNGASYLEKRIENVALAAVEVIVQQSPLITRNDLYVFWTVRECTRRYFGSGIQLENYKLYSRRISDPTPGTPLELTSANLLHTHTRYDTEGVSSYTNALTAQWDLNLGLPRIAYYGDYDNDSPNHVVELRAARIIADATLNEWNDSIMLEYNTQIAATDPLLAVNNNDRTRYPAAPTDAYLRFLYSGSTLKQRSLTYGGSTNDVWSTEGNSYNIQSALKPALVVRASGLERLVFAGSDCKLAEASAGTGSGGEFYNRSLAQSDPYNSLGLTQLRSWPDKPEDQFLGHLYDKSGPIRRLDLYQLAP